MQYLHLSWPFMTAVCYNMLGKYIFFPIKWLFLSIYIFLYFLESLFLSHSVIFYHDIKVFIMFYSCSASKESVQAENWYRFQRQLCGMCQDCRNHQVTASQGHSLQKPVCSHDINICIPILQDI